MHYMFGGCKSLTSIEIDHFDVLKIKNFDGIFSVCTKIKVLQSMSMISPL